MLQGNELIDSQLELKFRTNTPKKTICTQNLDDEDVSRAPAQYCVALACSAVWGVASWGMLLVAVGAGASA